MARSTIERRTALLGATLPLLLLLVSLNSVWPDLSNYEGSFETGSIDSLMSHNITSRLFRWFGEPMDSDIGAKEFDDLEVAHLRDVKIVLKIGYAILFALAAIWLAAFFLDRNVFWRGMLAGSIAGMTICILLAAIPFDSLFTLFHEVVFPQGNWMFPKGSFIVTLYPESLFAHLGGLILMRVSAMLIISCAIGWHFSRKHDGRNQPNSHR